MLSAAETLIACFAASLFLTTQHSDPPPPPPSFPSDYHKAMFRSGSMPESEQRLDYQDVEADIDEDPLR